MTSDRIRTLVDVQAKNDGVVRLRWSDGIEASFKLPDEFKAKGQPKIGEWGHGLEWPDGAELGADSLWLETLTAIGRDDSRQFLEWRLRNSLSLAKAAEALGLARRTVAYYSNGDRSVPKAILLACLGWEANPKLRKAA